MSENLDFTSFVARVEKLPSYSFYASISNWNTVSTIDSNLLSRILEDYRVRPPLEIFEEIVSAIIPAPSNFSYNLTMQVSLNKRLSSYPNLKKTGYI